MGGGVRWSPGHRENIDDRRFDPVPEHDVADSVDAPRMLIDVDDLNTLQLVILLVRERYEASGRFMTARELRAALRNPGS